MGTHETEDALRHSPVDKSGLAQDRRQGQSPSEIASHDIHGTDQDKLPRVVEVTRLMSEPENGIVITLNFYPTDQQMQSLWEHMQSWHP